MVHRLNPWVEIIIGFLLVFVETMLYYFFRPIIVLVIDGLVVPFTNASWFSSLATLGQNTGFYIDAGWLLLVLVTIVLMIAAPFYSINQQQELPQYVS
jgi:hypothetical protein